MIELKCTGGPYGDACSHYSVILRKRYTIKEFIAEVLQSYPKDWGTFYGGPSWASPKICEYKYGSIYGEISPVNLNAVILSVEAHGGWSLMDYYIKTEEGSESE